MVFTLSGKEIKLFEQNIFFKSYNSTFYHFIISQLFKTKIDYLFVSNFSQGPHFSNVSPFLFLKIAYCLHLSVREFTSSKNSRVPIWFRNLSYFSSDSARYKATLQSSEKCP